MWRSNLRAAGLSDACFAGVLGASVVGMAAFVAGDLRNVLCVVPDDCGYFLRIAHHAASGRGLTFDGQHPTNGVQPLWLVVLTTLFLCREGSPETLLRLALTANTGLLACAAAVWYVALRRVLPAPAALVAGVGFVGYVAARALNGMETGLLLLGVASLCACGLTWRVLVTPNARGELWFGLGLGLVVLARLDTLFLALGVAAMLGARLVAAAPEQRRAVWWQAARVLGGAAVVVVPYLVYNEVVFGSPMPISGALKNSFPHIAWHNMGERAVRVGKVNAACLLAALVYLVWWARARRSLSADTAPLHGATALLAFTILGHALQGILFMHWAAMPWHYALYPLVGVLVLAVWLARLDRPWLTVSCCALLVVAGVRQQRLLHNAWERGLNHWHVVSWQAASWARKHLPPDSVCAMKDAGNMGWFGPPTVNLDGLVNNMAYQEALRDRRLAEYLRASGVTHLVQHTFLPDERHLRLDAPLTMPDLQAARYETARLSFFSQRYGVFSDPLALRRADEVYRSPVYDDDGYQTVLIIWRLRW